MFALGLARLELYPQNLGKSRRIERHLILPRMVQALARLAKNAWLVATITHVSQLNTPVVHDDTLTIAPPLLPWLPSLISCIIKFLFESCMASNCAL